MLLSAALALRGCPRSEDPKPAATEVKSAAPAARDEAPAAFEVVDLLDLGRHDVSRFAYSRSTQELFVSFNDRERRQIDAAGDELQQWSVPASKLVHTYRAEKGWQFDALSPSPDGRHLVVRLYHSAGDAAGHWAKYALMDVEKRAFVALDLGLYNDRYVEVGFAAGGQRFRLTRGPGTGSPAAQLVYDTEGRPATAGPADFPERKKGSLWVIESSKATLDTHGLYYTDATGKDHRITPHHWHDNHALTRDGRHVVTTTWGGEILAWSTAEQAVVFRKKIASQYGYLAYDETNDRFLLGDATHDGTTYLRALVRTGAR